MKNANITVFLILSVFLISSPSILSASDETEFRDVPWGTDLSVHPDMRRISCEGSFCTYVRSGEELSMGDALISSVTYRTFRNHFVEVDIEALAETREGRTPGLESGNFLTLRQVCHDHFGPTSFAASFEYLRAEQYRWEQTGIRKVLKVNFNKNHMLLNIRNHDLIKKLNEEYQEDIPEQSLDGDDQASQAGIAGGTPAGESTGPADETAKESGDSAKAERGRKKGLKGFEKIKTFFNWLFVKDEPSDPDEPDMNTH